MKKDTYDSVSARIKIERKRLSLTQAEAASLCEVTRVQWGRYERGESEFGGRVLKAFGAVGAEIGYILTGKRTNLKEMEQPLEVVNAMDMSMLQLMTERKVALKQAIDQCANYQKLIMVRYVLDMNDADFAVFCDGVKKMESDVSIEEDKVASTQNFDNRSPVGQNIQGDVKIKAKGKRSQAAFNISNHDK
uniref:helix-turn-helix domain-containing protein n=1 Tax=uncultured Acinetobacter sp. TaxID=165433 RepID=UPI002604B968|nr:helix-turn-helix transcriptional regulator [uncultured Acinetobacter sp.]